MVSNSRLRSYHQSEFEETILEDLKLMGINGDAVSHTSDYFDQLYEYAIQMIKSGNAYADDTAQEQVSCNGICRCWCFLLLTADSCLR